MPQLKQIKEPEQKHVISKRITRGSSVNNGGNKQSSLQETATKGLGKGLIEISNGEISSSSSFSEKRLVFPRRPGYGQLGTKCLVKANHFIAELADMELTQYTVKIIPEVNYNKLNKAIMSQLVKDHRKTDLGMKLPVYDGRQALYTAMN